MTKIYKTTALINKDTNSEEDPFDAKIIPFEASTYINSESISRYFSVPKDDPEIDKLPKKLYFTANFESLKKYDVLWTNSGLRIFSKKVIQIIKNFGDFDFQEVPITMIDNTFSGQPLDEFGVLNLKAPINEEYYALRFLSGLDDYFDFENSEYTVPSYNPTGKRVTLIKKLVLIEPKEGFPAFFRTSQIARFILIREDLKQELDENDVKGYQYEEVAVTHYKKT